MNKQIEEMAKDFCCLDRECDTCPFTKRGIKCNPKRNAERAYAKGYRKQVEGEWLQSRSKFGFGQSNCSICNGYVDGYTSYRYCPHCGAKITGIMEKNGEEK